MPIRIRKVFGTPTTNPRKYSTAIRSYRDENTDPRSVTTTNPAWESISIPKTINDLHAIYAYDAVCKLEGWSQHYRAGFMVLCRSFRKVAGVNAPQLTLSALFVRQQPRTCIVNGRQRVYALLSPPKGQYNHKESHVDPRDHDASLLATAMRELTEETGIDLKKYRAKISPRTFMIARHNRYDDNGKKEEELLAYFTAVIDITDGVLPPVAIDKTELSGYEWIDINSTSLSAEVSLPTSKFLRQLLMQDFTSLCVNKWIDVV